MACSVAGGLRMVALFLLLAAGVAAGAHDSRLSAAREQLAQGRAAEAVKLLDSLEFELAADREYNVLFALALLDAGQPARALLPLNRLTRRNPEDPATLLLLSRARMALGQAQAAREALEQARKLKPLPQIARRVDQHLSVIAAAEEAGTTRVGGHLELAAGYDSNVNSATDATQIALPVFGGAIGTLSTAATRQSDNFFSLGGSIGLKHPLTASLAVVGSASASQRLNGSESNFDLRTLDGSIGLRYRSGDNEVTGVFSAQQFDVDYRTFRRTSGGSLQWRHPFGARSEVSAFGQYAQLSYPAQPLRDVDRAVAGLTFAHAFSGKRPAIVFASVYAGDEDERNSGVPFFGHRLQGIRLGVDKAVTGRFGASLSLAHEWRRYGGQDPLFLVARRDEQFDLRLALPYVLAPRWLLIPQVSHTYTRSNVELNHHRRTALLLALRFLF